MDVQFGKLAIGDKFLVRNYVSGEVRPDCPIREKIVIFQFKPGRTVNAKYEDRNRSFRFLYDFYRDDEEVVQVN